jgi:hypothetical protein
MEDASNLAPTVPARRGWFLLALSLLFIALSVQYSLKVIKHGEGSSAFNRWRRQVLEMEAGTDSYQKYSYPNPPMMAVLLLPYYKLPELAGALAWYYTKVALALAALLLTFRLVEDPARPFPDWAKALTALLTLKPIMGDLTHGNVNIVIFFLVVAGLYAFRNRSDFGAGVLVALAIVCKVTPGLFLIYFAWKRAWKTLAGAAMGMGLFYLVVPSVVFGPGRNLSLLLSWSNVMIRPFLLEHKVFYSEHFNQSLPGVVYRLCTHSPSFSTWIDNQIYTPLEYHNILDLTPAHAWWVILGCVVLYFAVVFVVCRTPLAQRQGWQFAAEFGIVLVGMLLFSERTWKHHCVTLCVPFAVLCYRLAWSESRRDRAWLITALALVTVLMGSTSMLGLSPRMDNLGRLAQVYGAYVWAFVVFVAGLSVSLWCFPAVQPVEGDENPETVMVLRPVARDIRSRSTQPGTLGA